METKSKYPYQVTIGDRVKTPAGRIEEVEGVKLSDRFSGIYEVMLRYNSKFYCKSKEVIEVVYSDLEMNSSIGRISKAVSAINKTTRQIKAIDKKWNPISFASNPYEGVLPDPFTGLMYTGD